MNKYYHRGQGECVVPIGILPASMLALNEYITSLPITAYCSPELPVGWLENVREEWQGWDGQAQLWKVVHKPEGWPGMRRIFLVPIEAKQTETYEQEAERMYQIPQYGATVLDDVQADAAIAAHITARQMGQKELEEAKAEVERLKGLVKTLFMAYRDSDTAEEKWEQFKLTNRIN